MLQEIKQLNDENVKLNTNLQKLQTRVSKFEKLLDDHSECIFSLEQNVSRLDQYGRRENIEIAGIPEFISDKELESKVLLILKKIGLMHIRHYDIVACHRLGKKRRSECRNTIVRFVNRKDALSCLKLGNRLGLCSELGFNNLRILENLCPSYRSIFEQLTELKENGKI